MAKSTTTAPPVRPEMPDPANAGVAPGVKRDGKVASKGKAEGNATPARRRSAGKTGRQVTPALVAQQYLLNAAVELFHTEGVRAVGVDAVVKRAGVNKMCLYRQYASKDELILAYLDHMQTASLARIDESIAKREGEPRAQMLQIFVDLSERASKPGYRGCPFVNVAAEFPDPEHAARKSVANYKAEVVRRFTTLARAAGLQKPAPLVDALSLILEGAYAASQTFGPGSPPLRILPVVARQIIEAGMAGELDAA
ncbi:TetR family transcriptional regulator [Pandoraea apista]|uniref:TetR family transcriptional regulator n=2 Tax=Pandoraea apista TaxID=93218 RepID=A0A5E5P7T0_9BURK|nr:TetR/AcrR family transcriptional regulator [Pandoraea apista]OXS97270.1 TetR family transcriptional regulator [Pandoraea apista]VVG72283.1 TetR family transcriptional regulator [Pandoraea apista]